MKYNLELTTQVTQMRTTVAEMPIVLKKKIQKEKKKESEIL